MPMTTSSTTFKPGDVVLVPFPFTDHSQRKLRPAVMVGSDQYPTTFGDLILIALTTQPQSQAGLALSQWLAAGLPKATWDKPIIGSFSVRLVRRKLGSLHGSDWPVIRNAVRAMIDLRF